MVNESSSNAQLLIVQYTGGSMYSNMLNLTQPMNQAYADMWGYDFLLVSGFLIQAELSVQNNSFVPESRATYNKVIVLERMLTDERYQHYDALLILDSDALLYDFSRDVSSLLPKDVVLVAHKVYPNDTNSTWNVNIGVTLWNLKHPVTLSLARAWKRGCVDRIMHQSSLRDSDQTPLHNVLRKIPETLRNKVVLALTGELGYRTGRFVKHFIRPDAKNWSDAGMETRLAWIQKAVNEVCEQTFTATQHPEACSEIFHFQGLR